MKTYIFTLTIFLSVVSSVILINNTLAQSTISATTEQMSPSTAKSAAPTDNNAKNDQGSVPNKHDNSGLYFGWVTNLLVGLGSGTIGVLITLIFNAHLERKRRRAEYLESQLRNLYGPLQFFTSSSEKIYGHTLKIEQAGEEEYGENWQKYTDQARSDKIQSTINVNNEYFAMTKSNNKRMVEILTNYYSLIEPEDDEIFAEFHTHFLRREIEFDESGRWKLPLELRQHVGDIYSLKPEFGQLVNRRFMEKKAELDRLSR